MQPAIDLSGREGDRPVPGTAGTLLSSGRTLATVLEASRLWHEAPPERLVARAILAAGGRAGDVPSWPRAWPDATVGDVSVRELTDAAALASEGSMGTDAEGVGGLAHCVAGYWHSCMAGHSRILSLRRASDGTRLSTAEVGIDQGLPCVVQHRGRGNSAPPSDAVLSLDAYLRDVREGRLAFDGNALAPLVGDGAGGAGYDVRAPGAWEAARDAWAPFMPRGLRRISAHDLARLADDVWERGDAGRWRP